MITKMHIHNLFENNWDVTDTAREFEILSYVWAILQLYTDYSKNSLSGHTP